MKFQNPSMHGSWTDGRTDAQTHAWTHAQPETKMPPQLLRSKGHKYYITMLELSTVVLQFSNDPRHDKTNKMSVHPAKTDQPVWFSVFSLSAWRKLVSLATQWAHSEDTVTLLVLSCGGLNIVNLLIFALLNFRVCCLIVIRGDECSPLRFIFHYFYWAYYIFEAMHIRKLQPRENSRNYSLANLNRLAVIKWVN